MNFVHAVVLVGRGWRGHSVLESCGGPHSMAASVSESPEASVMSEMVSTRRYKRHRLMILISRGVYVLPVVTMSMIAWSWVRWGLGVVMDGMSSVRSDRRRKCCRVRIHFSSPRCGMRRAVSWRMGVDVPQMRWAHFSWISIVFPRGVSFLRWDISARICLVPCSAKRWRRPAPPLVDSANMTARGVFRLYPRRGRIAIVN